MSNLSLKRGANPVPSATQSWVKGLPWLAGIWCLGAGVDRLWFALDHTIPAWDQAEYLTGAMNYWQALQQPQWLSGDWWTRFWMLSSKIPPLVYISTTPFLSLFGQGADASTLVNLFYSLLLLIAVYGLGVRLFNPAVGLWGAGLCWLLPGLYVIRLDYLLDYPLVAIVTFSFFCLTLWATLQPPTANSLLPLAATGRATHINLHFLPLLRLPRPWFVYLRPWLMAIAVGVSVGCAFLVKQPALFFLATPLLWLVGCAFRQQAWDKVLQLGLALLVALGICFPWYRTNWLLILTAGKRATVDSALMEGDPALTSLEAWIFYGKQLPGLISVPLVIVGLVGLALYWKRVVVVSGWSTVADRRVKVHDYGGLRKQGFRQETQERWCKSVGWLLVFLVGGYLLCSLNVNKDERYITPLLPMLALLLAQGLLLLPNRLRGMRWGAVGLAAVMMIVSLLPLSASPRFLGNGYQRHVTPNNDWHHAEIVDYVIKAAPYQESTIGVLPSLGELNQHNINYAGVLRQFQVYGRQVGTSLKQTVADARSLPWYLIKTGEQGAIRRQDAQAALTERISQDPELRLEQTWPLPDRSSLQLYRRRQPAVEVEHFLGESVTRVRLEQVQVPAQVLPGQPMPITYRWTGAWSDLKAGLVLLQWQPTDTKITDAKITNTKITAPALHDHGIGLGTLHAPAATDTAFFQITEHLAGLTPTTPGTYRLQATYMNRNTGETYDIEGAGTKLTVSPQAPVTPAPELDFVSQLRSLAMQMPQGLPAFGQIFETVGQLNQYDPSQDYLSQARQPLAYRLQQDPQNRDLAYGLALAQVLERRVDPAIAALEQVVQLDGNNPSAYAYLAFVNLYDFRPHAAQRALSSALALNPNLSELHTLNAIAQVMQGNLIQAWHSWQKTTQIASQAAGKTPVRP